MTDDALHPDVRGPDTIRTGTRGIRPPTWGRPIVMPLSNPTSRAHCRVVPA